MIVKLYDNFTEREIEADIQEVEHQALKKIDSTRRFNFKWEEEGQHEVYLIRELNGSLPLGLMSFQGIPNEYRLHINLIESSKENVGKDKRYERVAGCLIAFAARLAFERKYDGFISLTPKSELIELYVAKYGLKKIGRQLAVFGPDALKIIDKYL